MNGFLSINAAIRSSKAHVATHIYSSLSSSAAINLHRGQYFYTFFIQSSLVPGGAGVNVNKKRLNVRNRGRDCRDNHTMSLRQSSLHIVCTNATE